MCKYQDFWLNMLTVLLNAMTNLWARPKSVLEVVVATDGDPDETEVEIDP